MINLPNEPEAWDADLSYAYLERLYTKLKAQFCLAKLGDAVSVPVVTQPYAFVRHDVDVSLDRALSLARLEHRLDVRSTYHVMLDSPFYDVRTFDSRWIMREILRFGHEIGLHYQGRADEIEKSCLDLESLIQQPVRSLSFHRPVPDLLHGPSHFAGRVNACSKESLRWYLSDSRGRWREGDPLVSLDRPKARDLQILIHPIWWGPEHIPPALRLRGFLDELEPRSPGRWEELRKMLYEHILYAAAPQSNDESRASPEARS